MALFPCIRKVGRSFRFYDLFRGAYGYVQYLISSLVSTLSFMDPEAPSRFRYERLRKLMSYVEITWCGYLIW